MTSQGTAHGRFQRAIRNRNLLKGVLARDEDIDRIHVFTVNNLGEATERERVGEGKLADLARGDLGVDL